MTTETELDRLFIQVLAETKGETFDRVKRIQAIVAARAEGGAPVWDRSIHFDSDCIINGVEVKAGTVLRVGDPVPGSGRPFSGAQLPFPAAPEGEG